MALINNDTELRAVLNNVMKTVDGETSLYAKIKPYLDAAEIWINQDITASVTLTNDQTGYAKCIVAYEAYNRAIPSLDLILTPNGFGIVSNSNIAPASRDRVDALRRTLLSARDAYIDVLLKSLFATAAYQATSRFAYFTSSMFNMPDRFPKVDVTCNGGQWEHFTEMRPKAMLIEDEVVRCGLGREIFDMCRAFAATGTTTTGLETAMTFLNERLYAILFNAISNAEGGHHIRIGREVSQLVQRIRTNDTLYAVWKTTEVGKAWETEKFQNDPNASGYFF